MTYITTKFGVPVMPMLPKALFKAPSIPMAEMARRENARMREQADGPPPPPQAHLTGQTSLELERCIVMARVSRPMTTRELAVLWGCKNPQWCIDSAVRNGAAYRSGQVLINGHWVNTWAVTPDFAAAHGVTAVQG